VTFRFILTCRLFLESTSERFRAIFGPPRSPLTPIDDVFTHSTCGWTLTRGGTLTTIVRLVLLNVARNSSMLSGPPNILRT